MRRDREGWNGVISFFVVFGWKTSFDIRGGKRQQMWDEAILEKNTDTMENHTHLLIICVITTW
jgi:hypothetical protein